jgi:ketosteroid isomerase-like protein
MSEEQANAALLREAFDRWDKTKGSDPSMWRDYVTDDFKLWSIADGGYNLQFTAKRRGLDEFENYLAGLAENLAMDDWRLLDTIAEGDRVVGLGQMTWTNRKTGRRFSSPIAIVVRFRDGRICEYMEYFDTAAVAATMDAA